MFNGLEYRFEFLTVNGTSSKQTLKVREKFLKRNEIIEEVF